jgi:hypothetical protein
MATHTDSQRELRRKRRKVQKFSKIKVSSKLESKTNCTMTHFKSTNAEISHHQNGHSSRTPINRILIETHNLDGIQHVGTSRFPASLVQ